MDIAVRYNLKHNQILFSERVQYVKKGIRKKKKGFGASNTKTFGTDTDDGLNVCYITCILSDCEIDFKYYSFE